MRLLFIGVSNLQVDSNLQPVIVHTRSSIEYENAASTLRKLHAVSIYSDHLQNFAE